MSRVGHHFTSLTNKWRFVGDTLPARCFSGTNQAAIALADGRGFMAGGEDFDTLFFNSCFFYDIATGLFTATGNYITERESPIVQLNNGNILAVAGTIVSYQSTNTCELFDLGTHIWGATGALTQARDRHSIAKLLDGKVFTTGGADSGGVAQASSQVYDPGLGTWADTGALNTSRSDYGMRRLVDGRVLIVGGFRHIVGPPNTVLDTAEIWDPGTGLCTLTTHNLNVARQLAVTTLLDDGRVLIAGGNDLNSPLASCEIFDPTTQTFTLTGALNVARSLGMLYRLPSGDIVYAGGAADFGNPDPVLNSTEIFSQKTLTWRLGQPLNTKRYFTCGFLTARGDAVIVGGVGEDFLPIQTNELRVG